MLITISLSTGVVAFERSVWLRNIYTVDEFTDDRLFSVPLRDDNLSNNQMLHDLDLQYRNKGIQTSSNLIFDYLGENQGTVKQWVLNELSYDFVAGDLDWSIGKKVVAWGVGYGFRPLDVIQQAPRLTDRPRQLEGVPVIQVEKFADDYALTGVWFNRKVFSENKLINKNEWAAKAYVTLDQADVFAIAHYTQAGVMSAGTGFAWVMGNHFEWHAAVGYLSAVSRLQRNPQAPLLATLDPFQWESDTDVINGLIGGSWTWANGLTVLAEFWHDAAAYHLGHWQSLVKVSQQQRAILGMDDSPEAVYQNLAWNSQVFNQPNILQNNTFVRLSYTSDNLNPFIDVLWTPDDGGWVWRASVDYELNQHVLLFTSYRQLGGKANAAYSVVPVESSTLFGLRFNLLL